MKRYRPDTTLMGEEAITEDNFGEYVKYSEVAIKIGESITSVEQANQAVLAAGETIQKLVAENLALKKYAKIDDYDKCDNCGFESYVMPIETPATDAAIAEIKAQGVDMVIEKLLRMVEAAHKSDKETILSVRAGVIKFAANLRAGRKG